MNKYKPKIILLCGENFQIRSKIKDLCEKNDCEIYYAFSLAELMMKQNHIHSQCIIVDKSACKYKNDLMSLVAFAEPPRPTLLFVTESCGDLWHKISPFMYDISMLGLSKFIETNICNNSYYDYLSKVQGLLNNYLIDIGFDTKYMGYNYLKQALLLCLEDRSMIKSLNANVYPAVAQRYNTNVQNVNRNIRNLIEQTSKNEAFRKNFQKTSNRAIISSILNRFEDVVNDYSNMGLLF